MGELVRAGDVANREDVGVKRLERLVDDDGLAGLDAELLETVTGQPRLAADRDDDVVERDRGFFVAVLDDQRLAFAAHRFMAGADIDFFAAKNVGDERRHFLILVGQDPRTGLDLGHRAAEPGEGLRHFGADRPAADDH